MKKLVINISDCFYEKLRLECIMYQMSIQEILQNRITHQPFHELVEKSFELWLEKNVNEIIKD